MQRRPELIQARFKTYGWVLKGSSQFASLTIGMMEQWNDGIMGYCRNQTDIDPKNLDPNTEVIPF